MDQEIKPGAAVKLKGGGPTMTVLCADEPPPKPEFELLDLGPPSRPWRPGWRVAWCVQGALRFAVLPGEALTVVRPHADEP